MQIIVEITDSNGVEKSMIPYGSLEMKFYFCSNHSTETLFCRVNYVLFYVENLLKFIYFLRRGNCQTSMRCLCLSCLLI